MRRPPKAIHIAFLVLTAGVVVRPVVSGQERSQRQPVEPCPLVVSRLGRDASVLTEPGKGNVLEIRSCEPGVLQLVAWGRRATEPLVVETGRTSLVSLVMSAENVFVVETAGASSNVVQVVVFENGVPRLALNDSARAFADIRVAWKEVVVTLAPPGEPARVFRFSTGNY